MSLATPVRGLRAGLVGLGLVLALVTSRLSPPLPRGAGAPPHAFSAERALATLERVLAGRGPHPVGSSAAAALRGRLLEELRGLGYEPEVQDAFACSEWGVCAQVHNVIAERSGREPGPVVLLVAHYDSVPAGPGAGDDGSGVAALLEAARALTRDAPGRHGLALLFTDGEEAGLLGAQAFVEQHPMFARVGVVVNVEARGTGGPSLMFETSGPGNAWLIEQAGAALPRPIASSVFATIYDRLPNDTDLSVFKRRGVHGLNFAFLGEPRRYHTPLDDLAHLDRGSLQQHGDNVLALARTLVEAAPATDPAARVVFFDLVGLKLVRWSERLVPWLALGAFLGLALLSSLRRAEGRTRALVWGALGVLVAVALGAGLQYLVTVVWQHAQPGQRRWIASSPGVYLSSWSSGLVGAALAGLLVRRRGPAPLRVHGAWLLWAVLGMALARYVPGASYPMILPAAVAFLALAFAPRRGLTLLPTLAAAILVFPLAWFLYDAMGLALTPVVSALVALVGFGLAPFVTVTTSARRLLVWPLVGVAGGAALAALLPPDSSERPQPLSLLYVEDAAAQGARFAALPESQVLPEALRRAAAFGSGAERVLPWSRRRGFVAAAPVLGLPAPSVSVSGDAQDGGRRHLRLRAVSARGASRLLMGVPAAAQVEAISVAGQPVPALSERAARVQGAELRLLQFPAMPERGLDVELVLGSAAAFELLVADGSAGLPASGQVLVAARGSLGVPIQDGDQTFVVTRVPVPAGALAGK